MKLPSSTIEINEKIITDFKKIINVLDRNVTETIFELLKVKYDYYEKIDEKKDFYFKISEMVEKYELSQEIQEYLLKVDDPSCVKVTEETYMGEMFGKTEE